MKNLSVKKLALAGMFCALAVVGSVCLLYTSDAADDICDV